MLIYFIVRHRSLPKPRNINADDKLKPVFNGKKQVSMF